jgi:CspA family cold shock protein
MEKLRGKVAWFNNAKGYGFLSHDGGADVFCHFSSIQAEGYKSLKEGEEVLFQIVQGEKGPQADGVEVVPADTLNRSAIRHAALAETAAVGDGMKLFVMPTGENTQSASQ